MAHRQATRLGPAQRTRPPTLRLGALLALSLAFHAAGLSGLAWLRGQSSPAIEDVGLVELIGDDDGRVSTGEALAIGSAPRLAERAQSPPPSGADAAAPGAPDPATSAPADVDVGALEAARDELQGQVEALTSEKTDLAARLEMERGRAAQLEQQMEEARAAERERLARVRSDYDALIAALQGEIADNVIALERANERLTVTIVDRVLFPSGQATLTPEGRGVMARVGKALGRVDDRRIVIEGHTDDVPIGPVLRERFASNWELSAARATEVVRYLTQEAGVPAGRLSAAGRAATEPVASNASEEGRRRNRRIEIILLPLDDRPRADPRS